MVAYSPDASAIGRTFDLGTEAWMIGRKVDGPGHIDDPTLSREHFRIQPSVGAQMMVMDLGTSNGTFLNGRRLEGEVPLDSHAVIGAGDTLFVLDIEPPRDDLPRRDDVDSTIPEIVGTSLGAERFRQSLATVAQARGHVLLLGPTGAGKEMAAQAVHELADRSGPFVPVNCAAIPADIAEAEFFGHVKGAFTGAEDNRDGYFVRSDGGTLFLDEIGELPEPLQAKLLRVLEDGEVQPLGGGASKKIDLRVVAATLRDLDSSGFRKDLFARLGDWVLRLPALTERRADILPLFDHFLGARSPRPYDADVAEALLLHDWPMNVRELAKLAARTRALGGTGALELDDLPASFAELIEHRFDDLDRSDGAPPPETLDGNAPPRAELETVLGETKGNVKEAAIRGGWHRTQLYRWLRRYAIDPSAFRNQG